PVDVTTAGARRHLDVLDQLGEGLAAPGVDDGLLVLGGGPLGVAAHGGTLTSDVPSRSGRTARAPVRHPSSRGGTTWPAASPGERRRSYPRPPPPPPGRAPPPPARRPRPRAPG